MVKIAVLMTCYNRKDTTLQCLDRLFSQELPVGISIMVFLVDDGCTDGTGAAVKAAYPDIKVIQGSGNLFWCNGMRMAWEHAAKEDPDFYLWLNDDVELYPDAVARLFATHREVCGLKLNVCKTKDDARVDKLLNTKPETPNCQPPSVIIVGSCCDPKTGEHTYGGQRRPGKHPAKLVPVEPQDVPVECDTFEGNIVLVPRCVFKKIGSMRSFKHTMGDIDYGYLTTVAGGCIYVAPGFVGLCEFNVKENLDRFAEMDILFRLKMLKKRLPPNDWFKFLWKHSGWRSLFYWPRPYIRSLLNVGVQK